MNHDTLPPAGDVREVAALFFRMGLTAFGGPAAHIAMFRDEVVTRRKWMTDEHFLDMLGATNLIPGPNSTEMAIHIGYVRAGWRGLIAAGVSFILPAFFIVLALAAVYMQYGSTPTAEWLLYGIKPVIIAIVAQAIWGLRNTAIKSVLLAAVGVAVFVLYLLGVNEILLLFGGAFFVLATHYFTHENRPNLGGLLFVPAAALVSAAANIPISLDILFLTFLKIGALLYGGGYVLLAFVRTDFVDHLGWLTSQQLLDAVAVGQVTPGPLFTTATFIGYMVAGVPGAILSTIGIFLPSFIFVLISNPFIPRLRRSPVLSGFLDGVNAAALGLMAAVTLELAQNAVVDGLTAMLAVVAGVLLIRYKINSTWLILGGAVVGIVYAVLMGGFS